MNLRTALVLFWGIPSVILGVIIMAASGLQVNTAMPIAGTVVVLGWVAFFAHANQSKA